MNTLFSPNDIRYLYAALGWAMINYALLPHLLPWKVRRVLIIPAMLMHEFAHWIVAWGMGGFPRVNFRAGHDDDDAPYEAYVQWHFNVLGRMGNPFISIAPFAAGIGLESPRLF